MASTNPDSPATVTRLLHAARDGDPDAFDRLVTQVYDELRRLARHHLRQHRQSLCTTELVHEAYLKLADHAETDWQGRAHFFSIASRAMRQLLVDHARKRNAQKRGGDWQRTTLTTRHLGVSVAWDELIALDDALDRLDTVDTRLRKVVEHRFFGGMTENEVADVLDVSTRTVQRDWRKARAWLYKELYPNYQ